MTQADIQMSASEYLGVTVLYKPVTGDGLFDGWQGDMEDVDTSASADAYNALYEDAIYSAFPGADLDTHSRTSVVIDNSIYVGDSTEQSVLEELQQLDVDIFSSQQDKWLKMEMQ